MNPGCSLNFSASFAHPFRNRANSSGFTLNLFINITGPKYSLVHINLVEDTWINYSIKGLDNPNRPFPYHKYQTWNALIDYNQEVTSKTKKYLFDIQKEDLLKPVFRVNNDGKRRTSLVKD